VLLHCYGRMASDLLIESKPDVRTDCSRMRQLQ
jgi:hypothetical protein